MGFDIEPSHIQHLQGAAHGLHLLFYWSALDPTCSSEFGEIKMILFQDLSDQPRI